MQRSLARSVLAALAPKARCSMVAASSIASSSAARGDIVEARACRNRGDGLWLSTSIPQKRLLLPDARIATASLDGRIRQFRSLSCSAKLRSTDEEKDRSHPNSSAAGSTRSQSSGQESARQPLTDQFPATGTITTEPSSSTLHSTALANLADAPHTSAEPSASPQQPPSAQLSPTRRNSPNSKTDQTSSPLPAKPKAWTEHLRNATNSSRSLSQAVEFASTRTRTLTATLFNKLSALSAQYNTYSGYSAIEELKTRISQLESRLDTARSLASGAKKTYLSSVQSRSASQKETNDLLSRKNSWSEADLGRYTELLRKEHALSREEAEAEKELERSEAEVQATFDELMKAVMVRYHEEQIWSDRMRGWSTYGSLIVAALNAALFILAILLVEPYKRKKLAQTFESKLLAAEEQSRQLILASVDQFHHTLHTALTRTAEPAAPAEQSTQPIEPVESPPPQPERMARRREEHLVFASTIGVVVGAALSLLISWCSS